MALVQEPVRAHHNYHPTRTSHAPAPTAAPVARAPVAATRTAKPEEKKAPPPDPPLRIVDRVNGCEYRRGGLLGEGGFARVWEIEDEQGVRKAVKVIAKSSITSKKNKTKLWAEIKLHQMLRHPNIVRFEDCFEDEENVYMVLELCDHGSLMDLLRKRKRYTEPEARVIMTQLIGACQFMHNTNVIHRDLKLGNIFLNAEMDIKVGDLGLAALVEKPGDRKKTICGTPNYIAPEILFDQANGHSFEVDIWAVGVILYTLTIGKPPFQSKDVKAIYNRIRENRYDFPVDKPISSSAQDLIVSLLNPNPEHRPTLDAILKHRWFLDGDFPERIPSTAMDGTPTFPSISINQSRRNFNSVCHRAKIGVELPVPAVVDATRVRTALGPSIMQQERDFRNAIQPDSPVSALLHSAKQPLVQAPTIIRESALLRKLNAAGAHATLSPARRGKENVPGPSSRRMEAVGEEDEGEQEILGDEQRKTYDAGVRQRELANQKARIVSQMTGGERATAQRADHSSPRRSATTTPTGGLHPAKRVTAASDAAARPYQAATRVSLFDATRLNLDRGLEMGENFSSPHIDATPAAPDVFVASWLDYCTKYGMGFAMNDGTICVHFNDSSSLALAPGKQHFDYIHPSDDMLSGRRENHRMDAVPSDLKNKVYLTQHFQSYILDRLTGNYEYLYNNVELRSGMVFISKYLRMKHVIVFRLSNDVIQFNFYDHTKLILSQKGLVVSMIDKKYVLRTWSLEGLLQPLDGLDEREQRRVQAVLHKVQYARDVLAKIKSHAVAAETKAAHSAPVPQPVQPVQAAPSNRVHRDAQEDVHLRRAEDRESQDRRYTRSTALEEYRASRPSRETRSMKPIR